MVSSFHHDILYIKLFFVAGGITPLKVLLSQRQKKLHFNLSNLDYYMIIIGVLFLCIILLNGRNDICDVFFCCCNYYDFEVNNIIINNKENALRCKLLT